ncbi:MAG: hypothetical protein JNJ57_06610, partial [Saprospiraceae bacterium]|nr:hypothetical protein [Saprospiraceae bacterium]
MSSLIPRTGFCLLLPLFVCFLKPIHAQPVALASSNAPLCAGASELQLFETGGHAITWHWNGPNNFTSSAQNPVIQQPPLSAAGIYFVTISNAQGQTASAFVEVAIHQPGTLSCNDLVFISPGDNGITEILPQTVLQGSYDFDFYTVEVFTNTGESLGNEVSCAFQGQTLRYRVTDICDGNACWGFLKIDDKKPPKMVCSELIYTCATSNYAPEYMFNELGIQEAYPTVSDNCQS